MTPPGKLAVARAFVEELKGIEVLGAGTGSTADLVLSALRDNPDITCSIVPTSWKTASTCRALNLPVLDLAHAPEIQLGFDGADRVDLKTFEAIKGGGGALADEGIMAQLCKRYVLLVDNSKVVQKLGADYPLPIEVDRLAAPIILRKVLGVGAKSATLREGKAIHDPALTQRGNQIIDATFDTITPELAQKIKSWHGVAFVGFWPGEWSHEVWVGDESGKVVRHKK